MILLISIKIWKSIPTVVKKQLLDSLMELTNEEAIRIE